MTEKTQHLTRTATFQALRLDYLARVEAFAEELRPRFQAGELRGFTIGDSDRADARVEAFTAAHPEATVEEVLAYRNRVEPPLFVLEELCAARFLPASLGWDAQHEEAHLIRACSPSEPLTEDGQPNIGQAATAVAYDVLRVARTRGWYAPDASEEPVLPGIA